MKRKPIKIIYQYVKTENSQEKLDEIYDYIFTKTVEKYGKKLFKDSARRKKDVPTSP